MTSLKVFTQTSDKPYNRHDYKIVYNDGKEVIFDNYEDAHVFWFQHSGLYLNPIEVLDKKTNKGFK